MQLPSSFVTVFKLRQSCGNWWATYLRMMFATQRLARYWLKSLDKLNAA